MKRTVVILAILFTVGTLFAQELRWPNRGLKDYVMGIEDNVDTLDLQVDTLRLDVDSLRTIVNPTDSIITADSIKTRVLNYDPPHGVMVFADSAEVISLTQNIWMKITNPYDSLYAVISAKDITVDGDTMTVQIPGDYMMSVTMSFRGGPSDIYHIAIWVNNVITRFESHRRTSNNDTGYFAINAYLNNLQLGDDISVKIRNTADDDDPTLISSQVIVNMLHPR